MFEYPDELTAAEKLLLRLSSEGGLIH